MDNRFDEAWVVLGDPALHRFVKIKFAVGGLIVCLKCCYNKERKICRFCNECVHLCASKCQKSVMIKKANAIAKKREAERKRFEPIPIDPNCGGCQKPLERRAINQMFCGKVCRKKVQNARFRLSAV